MSKPSIDPEKAKEIFGKTNSAVREAIAKVMDDFAAEYPEEYRVVTAAGIGMGCTVAAESIKEALKGRISIIPVTIADESIRRN